MRLTVCISSNGISESFIYSHYGASYNEWEKHDGAENPGNADWIGDLDALIIMTLPRSGSDVIKRDVLSI